MINKMLNSPSIMTWASYFVKFGSSIFVLPLILVNFPESEIAVWLIFLLILGFSQLADTGFGPSVIRAASYYYSGAKNIPASITDFNMNQSEFNKRINFNGLEKLLNTANIIYLILGCIAIIFLLTFGQLFMRNSINLTDNIDVLNYAFYLIITQSFFSIQLIKYNSFIQGVDQVALLKKIETIIESFKVIFTLLVLILGYGIFSIVLIGLIFKLIFYFYVKYYTNKWFLNNNKVYGFKYEFDKKIFYSVWPATWRQGLMFYGGYLTNNGNSLIVSQLGDPKLISGFLLTQRLIVFVRQISQAPLYSNLPRIFQKLAKKEFKILKLYSSIGITRGLSIQIILLSILILFGDQVLLLFNVNTSLVPIPVMLIMSISIILELHHAFHAQIFMGTNHVPFLYPAIFSGISILLFGYFAVDSTGLLGLVIIQFLVQLSCNNWYPVFLNLRLLNWSFTDYLKDIFKIKNLSIHQDSINNKNLK